MGNKPGEERWIALGEKLSVNSSKFVGAQFSSWTIFQKTFIPVLQLRFRNWNKESMIDYKSEVFSE